MAFKNIQGNTRNSLLDYSVSGKAIQYHSSENNTKAAAVVTGGTILTPGDGNQYHVFTSTGPFSTNTLLSNASVMMIGGGGAGGGRLGGGGGAGGYLLIPGITIPVGDHTATVGGGGNAVPVTYPNSAAVRAPNTTFLTYTAYGGGGGSSDNGGSSKTGGSGGGGATNAGSASKPGLNPSTPAPIIASDFPGESHPYAFTQGYAGSLTVNPGGGGGAGGDAPPANRNGGIGVAAGLTLPPSYGTPGPTPGRWFGGGGGGMGYPSSAGTGGVGGGGAGSPNSPSSTPGTSGTDNTGGGGGGGGQDSGTSGAGGSGIVVIAYPIA